MITGYPRVNFFALSFEPPQVRARGATTFGGRCGLGPLLIEALVFGFRVAAQPSEHAQRLLAEILEYPGVPKPPTPPDDQPLLPIVPVRFAREGRAFAYFSTVTTLGTAQDVTLQEIRIECFHPADDATLEAARRLRGHNSPVHPGLPSRAVGTNS